MRDILQNAFIIKKTDFKESSFVLELLTPDLGKIKAVAKGAKKQKNPLFGIIDYLNELETVLYKSGDWYILKSATLQKAYLHNVSYQISKFYFSAIEILNQIIIHKDDTENIFKLLKEYLIYLPTVKRNHIFVFWRFLLKLYDLIGIKLFIEHCSICKIKTHNLTGYSEKNHGFVCEKCYKNNSAIPISKEAKEIFSKLYEIGKYLDNIDITQKAVSEINNIFLSHLSANFDKKFYLNSLK